jgi:hypothetical protein
MEWKPFRKFASNADNHQNSHSRPDSSRRLTPGLGVTFFCLRGLMTNLFLQRISSWNNVPKAKTVVFKSKTKEFSVLTRSLTPEVPVSSCEDLISTELTLHQSEGFHL